MTDMHGKYRFTDEQLKVLEKKDGDFVRIVTRITNRKTKIPR